MTQRIVIGRKSSREEGLPFFGIGQIRPVLRVVGKVEVERDSFKRERTMLKKEGESERVLRSAGDISSWPGDELRRDLMRRDREVEVKRGMSNESVGRLAFERKSSIRRKSGGEE